MTSRLPGFYRLPLAERLRRLSRASGVNEAELEPLSSGGIDQAVADGMIENVIGRHALPLAVALNFCIDDRDYLVPMAIEEPSVVAAASNAARLVRGGGGFRCEVTPPIMIGQIQICDVADPDAALTQLALAEPDLIERARMLVPALCKRGGGPLSFEGRVLSRPDSPDGGMIVVHVLIDCRDAMGANLVNTVAEGLADEVARVTGGRVGLRILSNLSVHRTVTVRARVHKDQLATAEQDGDAAIDAVVAASRFAELDPYRAATHNKGIMNGVDAVLVATANDWRGVEAGAHAYAARSSQYAPLAIWRRDGDDLVGELVMPMAVGTVGGALHVHGGARLCLALLGAHSAAELAKVAASAGLASNLAALRALSGVGIQRGHMALHARLVARSTGASGEMLERVAAELAASGQVRPDHAREILDRLRAESEQQPVALTLEKMS